VWLGTKPRPRGVNWGGRTKGDSQTATDGGGELEWQENLIGGMHSWLLTVEIGSERESEVVRCS
jgi:hypothetical protein